MYLNENYAFQYTGMPPSMSLSHAQEINAPDFTALLLRIAHHRDKDAFAQIFEHFAPRIKSFMIKGGAEPDLADELAQETMLALWHKAKDFDPSKAAPSTWIFTIARNKRIDAFRKNARHDFNRADPAFVESRAPSPREDVISQEEQKALAQALESLPREQADLIRKSFFEGKAHSEIAQETGLPLGTIKSRIRLALKKLRETDKVKALWI